MVLFTSNKEQIFLWPMQYQFNQFLLHHYFQLPHDLLFYCFKLQFLLFAPFGIAIELFATGGLPGYVRCWELESGTGNLKLGIRNWELGEENKTASAQIASYSARIYSLTKHSTNFTSRICVARALSKCTIRQLRNCGRICSVHQGPEALSLFYASRPKRF